MLNYILNGYATHSFSISDCWQHLRNVWFGQVIEKLGTHLKEYLESDLEDIHYSLRVTTDVINLLRAVEKYFGGEANYAKGKGAVFEHWMNRYHPAAYLFAVSRANGGSRQDIGVEGAVAVLMNTPFYLEFLIWRMRCGHTDGILERNLFMLLRSVEMISFLRVLSILHISICMPLRWLAGNCGNLASHKFGVADMATVVDTMDKAFAKVVQNGKKLLNEDFMMDMFDDLRKKLPPFHDYITYMFEERTSSRVVNSKLVEKVLPWDMLRSELFYPTRLDIVESTNYSVELASEAASIFCIEFRDEKKATAKYLSAIGGSKSMKKITEEECNAGLGVDASNSISESLHAAATENLKTFGTIDLQHSAGQGQTRHNKDFGRQSETFLDVRIGSKNKPKGKGMGGYHKMRPEIQRSALLTAKRKLKRFRKDYTDSFNRQFEKKRVKEEIIRTKKLQSAEEDYIDALFLFQQYHSKRCWRTKEIAKITSAKLKSESAQKEKVKVSNDICLPLKHESNFDLYLLTQSLLFVRNKF